MTIIIYITGPMSGYVDNNYPAFFDAEARLMNTGKFKIINPARIDEQFPIDRESPRDWKWYMRVAVAQMLEADAVALLPGWQHSRGARIEEGLARALGMRVRMWYEWCDDVPLHCPRNP